ncbi:Protein-lysine N-methyltransferase efm6 [Spiromyces aspiralis]|uniref:Protein-lysine N-methyltransferase efm6 n=1 Tax=Spiromyces aspiralis TaxID=68401 RepID=A0ACC1HPL2_9FUNG|nr:Protein-lysine N-methyltransferase efm6 [Spiromyces aspiralis]
MHSSSDVGPARWTETCVEFTDPHLAALTIYSDPCGTGGVGTTIWDSAHVLARYFERCVREQTLDLTDKHVLELGAGTGLVGLTIARLAPGARRVTLTDKRPIIPLLERNVAANASSSACAPLIVQELDWSAVHNTDTDTTYIAPFPPDIVVASDCIFVPELYNIFLNALNAVCGPETQVYLALESRDFPTEAKFFAKFGDAFSFRDIKPHELDSVWQSEDIFVFVATKKPSV